MAASWMLRHRSLRSGRSKSKIQFEDEFKLDPTCNSLENAWRLLTQLCTQNISTSRRFSLLNAFVILIGTQTGQAAIHSIFTFEELLICLRISLVHESTQIRAGALRALRRILKTKEHVQIFNQMKLPHLICRCIDIVLKNEMERIQAFQLIRRILILSPDTFSPVLTRAMVALGMGGSEQGERLLRACLAILCEIGILNSNQLIDCGGVSVILHNILECHSPRIAESLVGVLLHLLENPESRAHSEICLEMLASPYCDFQYRLGILDKSKDARDIRITCSRLALLSVLRSWAGTLQFCNPDKPSGLSSIISILYLNQLEVRRAVLDLLYELVGLPQPVWTDEYSVAVAALDPTDFQDQWRLNEGFVVAECRSILPTLVSTVPSPAEQHLALLLYFYSIQGFFQPLLREIINMMHILLPPEIYNTSPALPSLIAYASSNKPQALAAVSVLENLNAIMECKPASASVFLDQILLSGCLVKSDCNLNESQSPTSEIHI
ncbi:rapamycin-insensitive companion of mTOR-like [Ctenocephalides felis]|uniref:rapamycin-insensitive companion of mTOR-like n=1 Tax=Ctenocephalides felis TaxID=7515 RepID=UPI000E6E22BE|nr:rapamycin-insensitive companion of mTOR-like [Ctenocephalides felis]